MDVLGSHSTSSCLELDLGSFSGDRSVDLKDDGVHGQHSASGDTDFWVNLLENFEDLELEVFLSSEELLWSFLFQFALGTTRSLGSTCSWLGFASFGLR